MDWDYRLGVEFGLLLYRKKMGSDLKVQLGYYIYFAGQSNAYTKRRFCKDVNGSLHREHRLLRVVFVTLEIVIGSVHGVPLRPLDCLQPLRYTCAW